MTDAPDGPSRFKDGNCDPDGNYLIGRNRPPDSGKFRKGDGRRRGRRPKGTRNLDSDVLAEAHLSIAVNEGGRQATITKQRALVKRMFDKGFSGDGAAIRVALERVRIAEEGQAARRDRNLPQRDRQIIDDYFADRLARLMASEDGQIPPSPKVTEGEDNE